MKLLSFGEIIFDIYPDKTTLGGAPLNLAAYAAMLGGKAALASAVGNDALGRTALEEISALGIETRYIAVSKEKPTGQCLISLNENGIPSYKILSDVAYDEIPLTQSPTESFDILAFGTLALREQYNRLTLEKLIQHTAFEEIYTDLNIRAPFYSRESILFCLSHASIVKISDEELPTVTRMLFEDTYTLDEAIQKIIDAFAGIRLLLITCGAIGAYCFDRATQNTHYCPAVPTEVVSTVGAGDSFGGAFLAIYHKTKDILRALQGAAEVSAFVVSKKESIPPDAKAFCSKRFSAI